MYIPAAFQKTDQTALWDFIEANSFALLVSRHEEKPFASHLPLLLDRESGSHGTLIGHMARANPQWHDAANHEVLVVYSGPHAYISPTWYEAANLVPTWNYVAVHAYGNFQLIGGPDETKRILKDYVAFYERSMPKPWTLDAPDDFANKLVKMIVAFRIKITRLEGKWKLNQNHPQERREKVVAALRDNDDYNSQEIARLMSEEMNNANK